MGLEISKRANKKETNRLKNIEYNIEKIWVSDLPPR